LVAYRLLESLQCLSVTVLLVHPVEALGRGKLASVSDLHPIGRREPDRRRLSVHPECRALETGVRNDLDPLQHCRRGNRLVMDHSRSKPRDAEDFQERARARRLSAQSVLQPPLHAGLDCQNPCGAPASHHARFCDRCTCRHLAVRLVLHNSDACNDRRAGSVVNVDLAGNNPAGTNTRYFQTRRRKQTRPAPDATNCAFCRTGCAGTRPSSRCNKPNARSDTAPSPTARNQSTSNRKAGTTSSDHSDTAPSRCKR
jgi:hypothetical protein